MPRIWRICVHIPHVDGYGQAVHKAKDMSKARVSGGHLTLFAWKSLIPGILRRFAWCVAVRFDCLRREVKMYCRPKPPPSYPYTSEHGRTQKATIEHIFGSLGDTADVQHEDAPWSVGWQMNERNLVWTDAMKLRLLKKVAAAELQISEREFEVRLGQLTNLLPDLADLWQLASPKLVARLAFHVQTVGQRLLHLRRIFPACNASMLVSNKLSLLLDDDLAMVQDAAARLRQLLPGLNMDMLVQSYPQMLDVEAFAAALQDVERLLPGKTPLQWMQSSPDTVLRLMKGKTMIPYDEAPGDRNKL